MLSIQHGRKGRQTHIHLNLYLGWWWWWWWHNTHQHRYNAKHNTDTYIHKAWQGIHTVLTRSCRSHSVGSHLHWKVVDDWSRVGCNCSVVNPLLQVSLSRWWWWRLKKKRQEESEREKEVTRTTSVSLSFSVRVSCQRWRDWRMNQNRSEPKLHRCFFLLLLVSSFFSLVQLVFTKKGMKVGRKRVSFFFGQKQASRGSERLNSCVPLLVFCCLVVSFVVESRLRRWD